MKKLIAISVVFALVAGVAFAVDVTGSVIGRVDVLKGSTTKDSDVTAGGAMELLRIDGSGEVADGAFGGYIRYQANPVGVDSAYAWWKPLDQFKLTIGGFSDAWWGKEGVTGWMFNQTANDSKVALNPGIWCGAYWGSSVYGSGAFMHNRYTFFEGFQYWGATLEITPADIVGINVGIPFIDTPRKNDEGNVDAASVFIASVAQVNINLDVGNIAITYDGANRAGMKGVDGNGGQMDAGAIFAYFGGSFGDLGLDVGLGYHLSGDAKKGEAEDALPIGIGLGAKYALESFGIKFRATAALAGEADKNTYINVSLLPYFKLGDNLSAFVNVGLGMTMPEEGDSVMGWYFNPYLQVGEEWGPKFLAGVQVSSDGVDTGDGAIINWAVPIAVQVSF